MSPMVLSPLIAREKRAPGRRSPLLCLGVALLLALAAPQAQAQEEAPADGGRKDPLPERIERAAVRFSDALERLGLYPHVTSLATGGGAAPGLTYFDAAAGAREIGLYGSVSHSLKGDSLVELRLGRIPYEPGRAPSRRPGFEWMPGWVAGEHGEHRFFVYGQAKLLDLGAGRYLEGYSDPLRQQSADVVAGYRISPTLSARMEAGVLAVSPGPGAQSIGMEFLPALDAPGLAWKRDYVRLSSELAWDSRHDARLTRGGQLVSLRLETYQGWGGTPGFSRLALDARHYQRLGSDRHLLALRGVASLADSDGIHVPYYLQDSLGGGSLLRSYPEHRFSGDKVLAFSAEYRFRAMSWLQLAAFYDGGRAWDGFDALGSNGFRSSAGLGVRLTTPNRVLLRLDVARGAEGTRFNAKIGYAF
jgi:hypothetical protein